MLTPVLMTLMLSLPINENVSAKGLVEMTRNVWHEARGESFIGMLYVANVTMNRVKSSRFPNNVYDVIYQRKQFSWTHDKKPDHITVRNKVDISSLIKSTIASAAMYSGLFTDQLNGAMFYYNPYKVDPKWARNAEVVAMIGNHLVVKL